jgi:hypothetical protein
MPSPVNVLKSVGIAQRLVWWEDGHRDADAWFALIKDAREEVKANLWGAACALFHVPAGTPFRVKELQGGLMIIESDTKPCPNCLETLRRLSAVLGVLREVSDAQMASQGELSPETLARLAAVLKDAQ